MPAKSDTDQGVSTGLLTLESPSSVATHCGQRRTASPQWAMLLPHCPHIQRGIHWTPIAGVT